LVFLYFNYLLMVMGLEFVGDICDTIY